ncbi:MAG: toll/interleukin-1 receptor domain-containing protein [Methylococcus sp.]
MEQLQKPMAFMSYSHRDDRLYNGLIKKLCDKLALSVNAHLGEDAFSIFFDRSNFEWGVNWRNQINDSLNAVTFFIPVISPSFLASENCQSEFTQFRKREEYLQRSDLVFPIYLLEIHPDDVNKHSECNMMAQALFEHQCVDWRELKYSNIDDANVIRQIDILAKDIRSALKRTENSARSRSLGESPVHPRGMAQGIEQMPLGHFLYSASGGADDPRNLLELAMKRKKEGNYQSAKELYDDMLKIGIDWSQDISLFVDQLYFAISLHDKLEDWPELDSLERFQFTSTFTRIKPLLTTDGYNTVRILYQSEMALSMLRQIRLSEAKTRIEEVLAHVQKPTMQSEFLSEESFASAQILYANALMTRALVLHAKWSLEGHDRSKLVTARADVEAAEVIYRDYAHMGKPDEFHHLGRFYGTRAFLRIAEWDNQGGNYPLAVQELLDDAQRAHQGDQRTAYGRIAGKYCEAYCHFRLSEVRNDSIEKQIHLDTALSLLKSAEESLDPHARLARVKITGLAAQIGIQLNCNAEALSTAHQQALTALPQRGMFECISVQAWLGTPLN